MNNKEVAHRWANKIGESGKGSNFFFTDRAIYSYGHHFKIAEHVDGKPGHVFFTRRTYGQATSKHLGYTRMAISDNLKLWMVASFDDHAENVRAYLADMEEARAHALKARVHGAMYQNDATFAARRAGEYAQEFGTRGDRALKRKALKLAAMASAGELFSPAELDGLRKRAAAAKTAMIEAAARREKAEEARLTEDMAKLAEWVAGTRADVPSNYNLPTRLRLEEDRTAVVTSRGARISARTAALLWDKLVYGADVIGLDLDGYVIRSWNGRELVAGCHTIEAGELERIAGLLGLPGTLPAVAEVAS